MLVQAALFGVLLPLTAACRTDQAPARSPSEATGEAKPYEPLYRARSGGPQESRGTIRGDFQWATAAPTLTDAVGRWQQFLEVHNPPGQEFEDGLHATYVNAAQYELLRVYYLLGRRDDGDELLRRLDPPGWER